MKDYIKKQHSGNENGWSEEGKEVSRHRMTEANAAELNKAFGSTGTKYEPVEEKAEKPKAESKPEVPKEPAQKKAAAPKTKKAAEHKAE